MWAIIFGRHNNNNNNNNEDDDDADALSWTFFKRETQTLPDAFDA